MDVASFLVPVSALGAVVPFVSIQDQEVKPGMGAFVLELVHAKASTRSPPSALFLFREDVFSLSPAAGKF